jgi:hypothetical protein
MCQFLDHSVGWMPPRLAEVYDETSFWSARQWRGVVCWRTSGRSPPAGITPNVSSSTSFVCCRTRSRMSSHWDAIDRGPKTQRPLS